MKTFVSDDYQITLIDDDRFECRITPLLAHDVVINYNPEAAKKLYWSKESIFEDIRISKSIYGLHLTRYELEVLHKALEVINKQDLMDKEITFVNEK